VPLKHQTGPSSTNAIFQESRFSDLFQTYL